MRTPTLGLLALVLAACSPPDDPKPGDSDTAPDSATTDTQDTSPHETADTTTDSQPETADTAPDTEDTGVAPADWSPGDDIPGWEDADCAEPEVGQALETTFPDIFVVEGTFVDPSLAAWAGPHLLTVKLRDCEVFPCRVTDTDVDPNLPRVVAALDGTLGDPGEPRGQGWWGPDGAAPRAVDASGNGPIEAWSNAAYGSIGSVTTCISRLRPDEVRGVVRVELAADATSIWINTALYPSVVYRFPFSVLLADHAGFDASAPDRRPDRPDAYDTAHFVYERPYADAWPWDDITDPAIREAVYERYEPYNAP